MIDSIEDLMNSSQFEGFVFFIIVFVVLLFLRWVCCKFYKVDQILEKLNNIMYQLDIKGVKII